MWGTSDARLGMYEWGRAVQLWCLAEARVPRDHPLRAILRIVDAAPAARNGPEFEGLYAKFGRPSIPPQRLLRALLLQAFSFGAFGAVS